MAESEAAGCWNAATGLIASEWMRIARTRLRRGRGLAFNRFASTWPRHRGRASRPRPTPQNASERSPGKERRISNQSKNMGKWLHKRTKCCLPHTQTTKDLFLLLLSRRCVFSRSAKSVQFLALSLYGQLLLYIALRPTKYNKSAQRAPSLI